MALVPGMCTALNQETWKKLQDASIVTVVDFISKDAESLSQKLQLPYNDLCSIRKVLIAEHAAYPASASSLYQKAVNSMSCLSTGYASLDSLLDGGFYTGEVTELAGDSAAGKTTICHAACASAVASTFQAGATVGGSVTSVVYIDTSCSFFPKSILDNLLRNLTDSSQDEEAIGACLEKIKCVQIFDVDELLNVIDEMISLLSKESKDLSDLKLIILDNLANIIYPITGGGFQYSQGILSQIGHKLKQLAVSFSTAVVVTNNLVSSGSGQTAGRKAALGKLWCSMPHSRIVLEKCEDPRVVTTNRKAHLVKSCRQKTPHSLMFSLDQ